MLKDKTAVITGASRGIGKEIALKFAGEGADIAAIYSGNRNAAEELCAQIRALGRKASSYRCDVSNSEDVKETVKQIKTDFNGFDILVNNAGITIDRLLPQMKEEEFERVLNVNLKGAFHMIRQTYMIFARKRGGKIINIASVSGLTGAVGQANYSSAKAGLIGLTKSVARELAGRNVTCNAIAPGLIDTAMTREMNQEAREKILESIPMKRMGQAGDVANLALFLASDLSGYITGEVIRVDGGLCM
ncbi:3-oxoacyl-[acyl-carrier-protein] reductase FabG [Caprobacter fermentans]|uniref:3-oxoacyl-[acyl-carrier-protein] reductase n=1 Tax=Caproicibacter fermentans TaxID=2576756 RepID=A0A6N8I0M3_9FIRM|nr:3-oxoacyl-[acyl-carrier-protein] reductase [Caproicibacter fermentans]MVB11468.1 3-oxoacyl-[acyl-carrier-protein] reductase FabG [Caproicibacter fermentans]OCN02302.1 3-oxoacyl-[acyl-carrier-protein] reductase [Clostridium sp. W14A]QNK40987.1 3-oxoacyl-[acyl-carrier-protein] reductase [Caproicibacter fermentans]